MDSPNPNSSVSNNMTSPPFLFRDINWDTVTKDDGKFRAMASHKLGESFIQELSSADTDAVIEAALSCFTLAELQDAYALMVGGTDDTDTHIESDSFKCTDSVIRAILNVMPNDQGEDADSPAPRPAPTAAAGGAGAAPSPTPTPSSPAPAPAPAAVATSTATPAAATIKAAGGAGGVSGSVVSVTPNNRGDGSPNPKR